VRSTTNEVSSSWTRKVHCVPFESKMHNAPMVFVQITAGLDATELARAAARFPLPRASRTLRPYDHFAAMVFAHLTYRESLRGIEPV